MMNNMLGEEDLNPHGFNRWPLNQRMSSMMAPTMILRAGKPQLVLGSGGSNRIRTAILQVISNILDFGMPLSEAVAASRIHWENGVLHAEPGLSELPAAAEELGTQKVVQWQQANMFFGGVHAVGMSTAAQSLGQSSRQSSDQQSGQQSDRQSDRQQSVQLVQIEGAGDPRRSGAVERG